MLLPEVKFHIEQSVIRFREDFLALVQQGLVSPATIANEFIEGVVKNASPRLAEKARQHSINMTENRKELEQLIAGLLGLM